MRRALTAALLAALLVFGVSAGSRAEVTATHDAIITFNSRISPRILPRSGSAPVAIHIEGHVKKRKGRRAASLTKIEIAIHKAATLVSKGLPTCDIAEIDPASSAEALAKCPHAQIGHGRIRAESTFPGQPNASFDGRVLLFNGRLEDGRPAILIHVFNASPPSSFVVPFTISKRRGLYGTVLTARVRINRWSRVTDFNLVLNRSFRSAGHRHSYLNASCPVPKGFSVGFSPFVRATLSFSNGARAHITVVSSCEAAH